jgi:hypothetical protein
MTPDGKILVNDAASGTPLARFLGLDVPVLQLSASLFSDPADCGKRPTLLWWEVTWEPLAGVVELARNSIRPGRGEACMMQISVPAAGRVRVDVHDAAGQLVKVLWDDDLPAAAKLLSWGGETDLGSLVAPGVYFIAARVPGGGREVKRLAVIR